MRHVAIASLVVVLSACASYARGAGALPPGYGVSDSHATSACGSVAAFRERVAVYDQMYQDAYDRGEPIPLGGLVPTVGQTECEVLAMLGAPSDANIFQGEGYEGMTWTYMTGDGYDRRAHLVTLEFRGDTLTVTRVTW